MGVERVSEYLEKFGFADRIQEFTVSSATVELAAEALGVDGAQIAKTISFGLKDGTAVLIATAGDGKIDNRKFKDKFGCKASMLKPDQVLEFTGYAVGGVCPFDITDPNVRVYTDVSLKRFDTVYPAAGTSSSAVKLTPDELFKASEALEWIDVCKEIENQ